jgi:hypothetical protein
MKFSDYKKPCQNVGGILKIWLQNSCDVSEDISQELTFVTEENFYPSEEFAEYQFTRESARITEEEINNKNGRLVIYKLRFNLAKATIENEREINKLRNSDKIIVVAQDNNKQFRVFGNKCNPAEIKITYNSGTTKGNENIYSIEITSAEVQKPYRLPIPTDPPYVPPPRSVIPIYLNIASRTLVFKANWDYLSQRIYRMYGGLTTDSFVFKVNPNPLAVDESHPSWAALPYLNHAEFIASTINQDFQIWIECVFIDLLVTEVLIETGKASINLSNAVLIQQHYQTAASDIMLALPTVGSSSSNFSSAIASNIFYGRRENADFLVGEDFTDFSNTLADVNAGLNFSDVAHIHFENTVPLTVPTHFKTINVNFGSGNYEVAQIETPLKKQYYPFQANKLRLKGESAGTTNLYVPSGVNGADKLYFSNMTVGEERSYSWLSMINAIGSIDLAAPNIQEYFRILGVSNYLQMDIGVDRIAYAFENTGFFSTGDTNVMYVTLLIRRNTLTGTANNMYNLALYINGHRINQISGVGNITTNTYRFGTTVFNLGMLNGLFNPLDTNRFRSQGLNYLKVHKRILSRKEVTNLHLDQNIVANYEYDFTNLQPHPSIPSARIIPNSGTDTIDDAILTGHPTNATINLL